MNQPATNYILCSNPRSGTTLLCQMLADTGIAGRPDSFFRQKSLHSWSEHWALDGPYDTDLPEFRVVYMDAMRAEGQAGTGVFGMRLMGTDLSHAMRWLDDLYPDLPSDHMRFEAAFGPVAYIHLTRQDKLAEAVSYVRAEQSGLWHRNADGSVLEQIDPTERAGFDAAMIAARLEMLRALDADWTAWFAKENLTPLSLTYEALAENPQAKLAQVLIHLGGDAARASVIKPGLRKLSDQTSIEWMARFRKLYPEA